MAEFTTVEIFQHPLADHQIIQCSQSWAGEGGPACAEPCAEIKPAWSSGQEGRLYSQNLIDIEAPNWILPCT